MNNANTLPLSAISTGRKSVSVWRLPVLGLTALSLALGCDGPGAQPAQDLPEQPLETSNTEVYDFALRSDEEFYERRIATFEDALESVELELSPRGEELIAEGKALVGLTGSLRPVLHPNGVVETPDGFTEEMETYALEQTDPGLPWAFRMLEARVEFGLFNPELRTHRAMMKDYLEFQRRNIAPSPDGAIIAGGGFVRGDGVCNFWNGENGINSREDCGPQFERDSAERSQTQSRN
jgi:hypothetical protein